MILQEWIHRLEEGRWARGVKFAALLLGFVALAMVYDFRCYQGFASEEAMEGAQLARNLSEGRGFTTDSISPASLYLLKSHKHKEFFTDISTPPVYPLLLAGVMKALPFHFAAEERSVYQPELWIAFFNQGLFFAAIVLLFQVANKLFDRAVAWFSALLFAGTDLFWRFSLSGLSTLLLLVIFLGVVWCLIFLAEGIRQPATVKNRLLAQAVAIGLLCGLGGLCRYSFGWMVIPVVGFLWICAGQQRVRLCGAATLAFLIVIVPWLARNYSLSGNCFGTNGYVILQNTWAFPGDTLERSSNLEMGLKRVQPEFFLDKGIESLRDILQNELPKWGGNWISAFFLVGLLLPFRNPTLTRLRYFLLSALVLLLVTQALGRTHLTSDSPEVNSENLLILLAPLAMVYGVGMMLTLAEQMGPATPTVRNVVLCGLGLVLCAPPILTFMAPPPYPLTVPYFPAHIQRTAGWMEEGETMMSDIPWAVAWYGHRHSLLLSLDTGEEFVKLNKLIPIKAVYLTQKTGDKHFQSQAIGSGKSWEHLLVGVWAHDEVPDGFPLWKAPTGYWPDQTFLSDRARWREPGPVGGAGNSKKE